MPSRSTACWLLSSLLVLRAGATQAQGRCSVGPRLGLNLSTYGAAHPGTPGFRTGVEAGLLASATWGHVSLQPALLVAQTGFSYRSADVTARFGTDLPTGPGELRSRQRLHYLTLPVSVAYAARRDGQGLQVLAGPYLGLLLGGRYDFVFAAPGQPDVTESGPLAPGTDARRLDAGLQAGLGYRRHAYWLQVEYDVGLRNIAVPPPGHAINRAPHYNKVLQASLAYLFGPAH